MSLLFRRLCYPTVWGTCNFLNSSCSCLVSSHLLLWCSSSWSRLASSTSSPRLPAHIILQTSPLPKYLLASYSGQEASVLGAHSFAHWPGSSILVSLDQNATFYTACGELQRELLHCSIKAGWEEWSLQLLQPPPGCFSDQCSSCVSTRLSRSAIPWWWTEQTSEQIKAQTTALARTCLVWSSLWSTHRCSRGPADVLVCHVKSK